MIVKPRQARSLPAPTLPAERGPHVARVLIAVCVASMIATACSTERRAVIPTDTARTKPVNVVAIGDWSSLSFRSNITVTNSWPQIFFREALPRNATFVNLATPYSHMQEARQRETSVLPSLHPDLVTVLLGFRDYQEQPGTDFVAELNGLLDDIERSGASRAMVAILPTPEPGLKPYADAIAALPKQHGKLAITLVDLRPLTIVYTPDRGDRFIPEPASQRVIADAFIDAYRKA